MMPMRLPQQDLSTVQPTLPPTESPTGAKSKQSR
jgi:hypothetical protein